MSTNPDGNIVQQPPPSSDVNLTTNPITGKRRGRDEEEDEATGETKLAQPLQPVAVKTPEEQIREQIRALQTELEKLELQKSRSVKVFEEKILKDCNYIKDEKKHEYISKGLLPRFDLGYRWNKPLRKSATTSPLPTVTLGAQRLIQADYAQWRESAISSFGRNPVFIYYYKDREEKTWIVIGQASLEDEKEFRFARVVRVEFDVLKCPGKNKLKHIDYPGGIGSVVMKFGCGAEDYPEAASIFWFGDADARNTDMVVYALKFDEASRAASLSQEDAVYLKSFSKYAHLFSVNPAMLVEYEFRITRRQPSDSSPSNEVVAENDIKDSGALWPEDHAYIENRALPASNSTGYKDYYIIESRDFYTYAIEGGKDQGEKLDKEMWFDTASTREKVRAVFSDAVDSSGNPDETRVYPESKKAIYKDVRWILSHLQVDTATRTINSFVSFSSMFFGNQRGIDLFCLLRMIYEVESPIDEEKIVTYTVHCSKSSIDYWLSLGFGNPAKDLGIASAHKGRYVLQLTFTLLPFLQPYDETLYRVIQRNATYEEIIRKQQ
jgi:hypothetical protein